MKAWPIFLLLLRLATDMACADGANRSLRIVCDSMPPFAFEENGQAQGISVDITKHILERMDVPCTIQVYPWRRVWLMLEQGSADAALNVSYQAFRTNTLLFTDAQIRIAKDGVAAEHLWCSEYVFFVRRDRVDLFQGLSYSQIEDGGYRVGIDSGFSYNQDFRNAQFRRVPAFSPQENMTALAKREIDLYACDRFIGMSLVRSLNMEDKITFLPDVLFEKPYLAVFSAHSDFPDILDLRDRFHAELEKFRQEPLFSAIYHRHGLPSPDTPQQPIVFVCEPWIPFEYPTDDGSVIGINSEVIARIMNRLDLPHEIKLLPWNRAWMMIERGHADAVISISYHSEREPFLYYTPEQALSPEIGSTPPDYLWNSEYVFFIKKTDVDRIQFTDYEQLIRDGYRVGTNRRYSYHPNFPKDRLTGAIYHSTREGFIALISGQIDLYPMDRTVGLAEVQQLGLSESITFFPDTLFTKPYLVVFSRMSNYPEIRDIADRFNRELRLMRSSGEYDKIREKYTLETKHP